jgi:cathepsin L
MPHNETDLQVAIATVGPISVAVDASHSSFQFYSSGIYDEPDCSDTQLNHAMLAVGYNDTTQYYEYYMVKNSW